MVVATGPHHNILVDKQTQKVHICVSIYIVSTIDWYMYNIII